MCCETWKLHVNVKKTKIVIFSKGPVPKQPFRFKDEVIEIVKELNYLGILFSRLGSFCKAKKIFVTRHKKPCTAILEKYDHIYNLPFDCQLDLFNIVVTPVLLYRCEIWGFEKKIESNVSITLLKYILNFKSSTLNFRV